MFRREEQLSALLKVLRNLITFTPHPISEGNPGRDSSTKLEAGTKAETKKKCCLLACSACFLTAPRTTCLGMALPTNGLHPPMSIMNPNYAPMDLLTAGLMAAFFTGGFFSPVSPAPVKVTKTWPAQYRNDSCLPSLPQWCFSKFSF